MNDSKLLLQDLMPGYNKYVRPVWNQDQPVNVSMRMHFKAIQEFNEVQEKFSYVAGLFIEWRDDNMEWNPADYGYIYTAHIAFSDVWIPEVILANPSTDFKSFSQKWQLIRYFHDGNAHWLSVALIETNCPLNARYYPFDTQICVSSFVVHGYSGYEVRLQPKINEVDLTIYAENSGWTIKKTRVQVNPQYEGSSQIDFYLYLKRKPAFVIISVVVPIPFLSLLNVLVFVLVPESGERVSFCITVLLSITVFLTIVSDTLPMSSEPVPLISYKLMADMCISSLIALVTVLNLRVHNKDERETKPQWIVNLYKCLNRRRKCDHCDHVRPNTPDAIFDIMNDGNPPTIETYQKSTREMAISGKKGKNVDIGSQSADMLRSISMTNSCNNAITWKNISAMWDTISLAVFTFATLFNCASFIIYTCILS